MRWPLTLHIRGAYSGSICRHRPPTLGPTNKFLHHIITRNRACSTLPAANHPASTSLSKSRWDGAIAIPLHTASPSSSPSIHIPSESQEAPAQVQRNGPRTLLACADGPAPSHTLSECRPSHTNAEDLRSQCHNSSLSHGRAHHVHITSTTPSRRCSTRESIASPGGRAAPRGLEPCFPSHPKAGKDRPSGATADSSLPPLGTLPGCEYTYIDNSLSTTPFENPHCNTDFCWNAGRRIVSAAPTLNARQSRSRYARRACRCIAVPLVAICSVRPDPPTVPSPHEGRSVA
ncbi:hypothetical protein C8Q76DRAFT_354851 [Earliella scabrosa]|nr:hypothetical protein C8Q76DRAFT_354851 [Earliella scabrosa]